MKKGLLLILALLSTFMLSAQQSGNTFYYEQTFDNPADFPNGEIVPQGWTSTSGVYPLQRWAAMDLGLTANSGDYILGSITSYEGARTEVVYTQAFSLKGGVPCKIGFAYIAPGGMPPIIKFTNLVVTAGTGTTPETQTIQVGEVNGKSHTSWKNYNFEFTPETDGEYYIAFALKTQIPQCGSVALDDITIEGEKPAETIPATPLDNLKTVYADNFDTTLSYIYKGEATISFVDATTSIAYLQDTTAGATCTLPTGSTLKAGDKITDIQCMLNKQDGLISMTLNGEEQSYTLLSSSNELIPATVTLDQLTAAPASYANMLIVMDNIAVKNAEAGDIFEETLTYSFTDGKSDIDFAFLPGANLYNEAIPTGALTVTGISTSALKATLAPRSITDLKEHLIPVLPETKALPYQQSFDNENKDYDGTSYLPAGWTTSGTQPFITAGFYNLEAVTGLYYMVTPESPQMRDEHAYTPYFDLKAGTEYSISFYLYMPGGLGGETLRPTNLTVTAGKEQSSIQQTNVLLKIQNKSIGKWELQKATFTPATDGIYCFGFNLSSETALCGDVGIEDVCIQVPGQVLRPTVDFSITSWFDIIDSRLVVFENKGVKMTNLSKEATEYEWNIKGAVPETSTEKDPSFIFPNEGKYTIALTAKNSKYSKTTYKEVDVKKITEKEQMGMMSYNPNEDKIRSTFDQIPTFATDKVYDFASGFNHYYRRFAERFELPSDKKAKLESISIYLVAYSRMTTYRPEDRNHPLTLSVYGETDGLPDENKLLSRKVSTVADIFGDMGIGLENPKMWAIDLVESPLELKGNCYLAFEFDDAIPIFSDDPNITRSYLALGMTEHKSKRTTLYVKPTAGPDGFKADGKWCNLDKLKAAPEGLGLYLVLWMTFEDEKAPIAIDQTGHICFATLIDGSNLLVSGTQASERLVIYNLAGQAVLTTETTEKVTNVNISTLPAGTYVVCTPQGTAKIVIE